MPPSTAATLLRAAAIPVADRRVLAACYGEHRRAGLRARSALAAVAARFRFTPSVVAAAIFGGVWTCETCGRTSYRLAGCGRRYLNGAEFDPCCEKSLTPPRDRV